MNKKLYLTGVLVFTLIFSFIPGHIRAQTDPTSVETSSTASGEVTKTSGWNLFFLGVKERISLLTTFNPINRAEKALKFADERTKLAETLADKTDDPKMQEKVQKMMERAEELSRKAEEQKDKLLTNPDVRAKQTLKNILNFQEQKEGVYSKLEEKLTPDQLKRFQELMKNAEEKRRTLLNALENSKIPEDVREHLKEVKERIEMHRATTSAFVSEQKALLDRIKEGDDSAKEELKNLREERQKTLEGATTSLRTLKQIRPLLPLQERPRQ